MAFIELAERGDGDGRVAELFAADERTQGYVSNFTRLFGRRPEVFRAWRQLNDAVKANMDPRRYELTTLAAARRLRSSYCALAHGKVLRDRWFGPDAVRGLVTDHHQAGLDPADVAVMDFADKVASGASAVTAEDVEALRAHGLQDTDILDVALAAAARCFFSTVLDAMGLEPDAEYRSLLEPDLRASLTVGRPVAAAAQAP